jgi:hypothetical protein
VEEKALAAHEGWDSRPGCRKEARLRGCTIYSSHAPGEWWEEASRHVYSRFRLEESTVVVINGDRASWIRQGTEWFGSSTALYQIDRYHLKRDLARIFKDKEVLERVLSKADADPTGAAFVAALAEERVHVGPKSRAELDKLIADIAPIAESVCDYRVRLRARGIETTGLRSLGAAEAQMERLSDRTKKCGRSWSWEGLQAMMALLRAKCSGTLESFLARISEEARPPEASEDDLAKEAASAVIEVLRTGRNDRACHAPIMDAGIVRSGGLSHVFHELASESWL